MYEYIEIQLRKKAHELVLLIYKDKVLGDLNDKVVEKLKDAISSVPAEIFEAHGRYSDAEKIRFLSKARGYLYESRYYLELLRDLKKISKASASRFISKVDLLDKLILSMIKDSRRERSSERTRVNYFYKLRTN